MHRFLSLLLAFLFVLAPVQAESRLSILALNFPAFDLARSIAGETADVKMLLPPGSESHSYEPTPQDIIAIQNADLFLYTGGASDTWVESILASMGEKAPRTFRLSDSVTLLEEETSESMQHVHVHDHDHCEDEEHHHHAEMDEHVWTSPKNMQPITAALCETLCGLRPENATL